MTGRPSVSSEMGCVLGPSLWSHPPHSSVFVPSSFFFSVLYIIPLLSLFRFTLLLSYLFSFLISIFSDIKFLFPSKYSVLLSIFHFCVSSLPLFPSHLSSSLYVFHFPLLFFFSTLHHFRYVSFPFCGLHSSFLQSDFPYFFVLLH